MFGFLRTSLGSFLGTFRPGKRWCKRTLVVGPYEPVDGDSIACTKALIIFLRRSGLEAFTLPTLSMFTQIEWVLERSDFHPQQTFLPGTTRFMTDDLQKSYDELLKYWRPDEIVVVDGSKERLGFDPRGVHIYCIDHHERNEIGHASGKFVTSAPSTGCVLIEDFNILEPILAVSILTDTFWLRQNHPSSALKSFARLTQSGLTDSLLAEYQRKLMVKKDSHLLQAIRKAEMRFFANDQGVFAILTDSSPELHRSIMGQLGYFCEHLCVVRSDGYVSVKTSNPNVDLSVFARKFGGGGHQNMAAIKLATVSAETIEAVYNEFKALFDPR